MGVERVPFSRQLILNKVYNVSMTLWYDVGLPESRDSGSKDEMEFKDRKA